MTTNYNDENSCSVWKKMLTTGFWVIYPIMGVCLLHVLWLMNDRMDDIMVNSTDLYVKAVPFKDLDAPIRGSVIKGLDVALLKKPSEAMIAKGAKLYTTNCTACHGSTGNNGTIPGARKFGTDPFKNGREISGVFKSITEGLPGGMPQFGTLSVEDRVALSHHVRSYSKESPAVNDADIAVLDKAYAVTTDKGAPHRVPIAMAMELLVDDSQGNKHEVDKVLQSVQKDRGVSSALLKSSSNDLKKTIVSFKNSHTWKKDLDSFVKFISVNIQSNGLESKILLSEKEQLVALHKYLVGLY